MLRNETDVPTQGMHNGTCAVDVLGILKLTLNVVYALVLSSFSTKDNTVLPTSITVDSLCRHLEV